MFLIQYCQGIRKSINSRLCVYGLKLCQEDSDWTLGKISSSKVWLDAEMGCPKRWWSHLPRRCSENI